MKYYKLLIGLFLIQSLSYSCLKDDKVSLQKNYKYEHFSSNLNDGVNCVFFIDNKIGFVSNSGKIFKTVDSGISWQGDSITDLPINSIYFVNNNIGFAVGGDDQSDTCSFVFKTTNSGVSWIKKNLPKNNSNLYSVFFINENVGFAVGLGNIKTSDGGENWQQFEFEDKGLIEKIFFVDSQTGFAMGIHGLIFKTTDEGNNWKKISTDSDGNIYDFCFIDKNTGYAGGQKKMIKTTDSGNTWSILANSPGNIYFIHFADANNGIAIGYGHYTGGDWGTFTNAIYFTRDGGNIWGTEDNINFGAKAYFPSSTIGYSIVLNSTYKITFISDGLLNNRMR